MRIKLEFEIYKDGAIRGISPEGVGYCLTPQGYEAILPFIYEHLCNKLVKENADEEV